MLGGVSGRTFIVKTEWGELGSLGGGIIERGDEGDSCGRGEGELADWGTGSVDSDVANKFVGCDTHYWSVSSHGGMPDMLRPEADARGFSYDTGDVLPLVGWSSNSATVDRSLRITVRI